MHPTGESGRHGRVDMKLSAGAVHIFRLLTIGLLFVLFTEGALAEKPAAGGAAPALQKKLDNTATKPATEQPVQPAPPGTQPSTIRLEALSDIKARASRAERMIPDIEKALSEARMKIARPDITIKELDGVRGRLEKLRLSILAARKDLEEPIRNVKKQLQALGPAPKDPQAEDPAIAAQRKALLEAQSRLGAADKKLNLLALELAQLSRKAADRQREILLSSIFQPSRSVLNPLLWFDGLATLPDFLLRLKVLLAKWSTGDGSGYNTGFLAAVGLFLISLVLLIFVWRRWRRPLEPGVEPGDFRRIWRALRVAIFSALVVGATLIVLNVAIYSISAPSPRVVRLLDALAMSIMFSAVVIALARGIFRPQTPYMRLVNISDAGARSAFRMAAAIAIVYSVDYMMGQLAAILFMPVAFSEGWSALVSIVYIILVALFMLRVRQADPLEEETSERHRFFFAWVRYVFHFIWLILLGVAIALMLGYVALAHFVTTRLVLTASIVAGLYLLHHLADAMVRNALDRHTYTGQFLRTTLSIPERTITQLGVLFSTLVDIGTVLVGLPVILMLWAVNWTDMTNWAQAAFFGFKVGNITIEPASILLAVVVLIIGLILARLITLWLDRRVLDRMNLDSGIRHSLITTSKYALTIGAFLVALSVAGVNYTSLAFMGGALGIGIGFGLQSIVNNFVSGLILLAERPIKVGDWIKVSGGEGVVRKIKVRSTEIETFDRCSIIVPNSSLISEPVSNWYHSSRMGRLRLPIGVSYDADPDEVEKILLRCANSHPRALAAPKAFVLFTGFGDNSLDFELRVYIDDAGYLASVGSDLRFAIFRAFREANIEIPFPQRDIHVRSLPPEIFDRGGFPPELPEVQTATNDSARTGDNGKKA